LSSERPRDVKKKLIPDDIVKKVRPDPGAEPSKVIMLNGFLGEGKEKGRWRLYLTPQLTEYVEIAEDDIVHSVSLATEKDPLLGTQLWVKSDANITHTRVDSQKVQAEFFKGEIATGYKSGEIQMSNASQLLDVFIPIRRTEYIPPLPPGQQWHIETWGDTTCPSQRCLPPGHESGIAPPNSRCPGDPGCPG
jgi:hypothetical protein